VVEAMPKAGGDIDDAASEPTQDPAPEPAPVVRLR